MSVTDEARTHLGRIAVIEHHLGEAKAHAVREDYAKAMKCIDEASDEMHVLYENSRFEWQWNEDERP